MTFCELPDVEGWIVQSPMFFKKNAENEEFEQKRAMKICNDVNEKWTYQDINC